MKKRRLTTTAVLATLLTSTVAPTATQAAKVNEGQQEAEQSKNSQNIELKESEDVLASEDINKSEKEDQSTADQSNKDSENTSSENNKEESQKVEENKDGETSVDDEKSKTDSHETSDAKVTTGNELGTSEFVAPVNETTEQSAKNTNTVDNSVQNTTSASEQSQSSDEGLQSENNSQTNNSQQSTPEAPVNNNVEQAPQQPQLSGNNTQQTPATPSGNASQSGPSQSSNNGYGQQSPAQPSRNNNSNGNNNHRVYRSNNGNYNKPYTGSISVVSDASDLLPSTPIKVSTTMTGQEFVDSIGGFAAEVASKNDLYASVMIAQACLETGFGSSTLSQDPYYNFFGIKGEYKGASVSMSTQEDSGSGMYTIEDSFRQYPSPKESFEDYAELMHKDMYKGVLKSNTQSYQDATKFLTGRYATDHQYAEKLNAIIEAYDLTKYDNVDGSASQQLKRIQKEEDIFYDIKLGDTLSKIAEEYNTTVDEIQKNNADQVKDVNLIYSGQKLKVGKKVTYEYKYDGNFANSDDNNINAKQGDFTLPLKPNTYTVTSEFGGRWGTNHDGIDLATPEGSSVYAAKDGKVAAVGFHPSAGNYVILDHGNNVYTNYFHLSQQAVRVGDTVKAGQMIAKSGNTGNSTGPHLHFGISNQLWNGYSNPRGYLNF